MTRRPTAEPARAWLAAGLLLGLLLPTGVAAQGVDFDHEGTRFPLTGAHERVPCDSCHLQGVFRGTPTRCEFCHDGTGLRAETGKSRNHVRTDNDCARCHTSRS